MTHFGDDAMRPPGKRLLLDAGHKRQEGCLILSVLETDQRTTAVSLHPCGVCILETALAHCGVENATVAQAGLTDDLSPAVPQRLADCSDLASWRGGEASLGRGRRAYIQKNDVQRGSVRFVGNVRAAGDASGPIQGDANRCSNRPCRR
jgi:hypothetical protein